ncbi:MAG: hypothetical protein MJZ30_10350 [Paludibacteraceae bacterium]|nr:hypothetical protein [Paludibacteraceae bacterium]
MPDNSSANKRIAKNSVILTIQLIFVLLLTLYTTRVMLDILGVIDYGVYNVVCGFVTMFTFLNTSMSNGIQRFFNYELGQNGVRGAQKVFNTAVYVQIFFAGLIILFTETFGLWYLYEKMIIPDERITAAFWIFQSSILSFLFIILQSPFTAAVMAHEKMGFYSSISLIDAVLKLVVVLTLPLFGGDQLVVYGILFALISVFNFTIYFTYCRRNFDEISFRLDFDRSMFKSMLIFSGWNVFGSFANMMREQGINLVLNLFFGPLVNAARAVAAQVNGGLQSFVYNLTTAMRPQVVQSYAQGNIDRTMRLTFSISKLSCFCLYLISLPILVDIDFVLHIWLGSNVPAHTSSFIYIIVLTSFLNNLNSAVSGVVHASGRMKLYQLTGGGCILLVIPLAYFALKMGAEPEWALLVCFFTMIIAQIVALIVLKTIVDYSIIEYVKRVLKPFFSVVILSFWIPIVISNQMQEGFFRFVAVGVVSVITTSLLIFTIGLDTNEKGLIIQLATKIVRK